MQAPCKDCPDRVLGCHSTCEKYLAFVEFRKEVLKKIETENRIKDFTIESILKRRRRRR